MDMILTCQRRNIGCVCIGPLSTNLVTCVLADMILFPLALPYPAGSEGEGEYHPW